MFRVPSGYSCITIPSSDVIYAYNSNVRDTFRLSGLYWVKVDSSPLSSSYNYCSYSYAGDYYAPSSVSGQLILSATLVVLSFFATVLVWFRRVRR